MGAPDLCPSGHRSRPEKKTEQAIGKIIGSVNTLMIAEVAGYGTLVQMLLH
jgi:hypothetical protein